MIDYIEIIAKKILEGKRVALYTVGGDTFSVMRALRNRFQVSPAAVCDKDNAKQGRTYRGLYGVPVLSFEEADRLYPDAEYYISSLYYKYQIIGELTSSGKLDSARIINYEPVEWRTSCVFWEKLVCVKAKNLSHCWEWRGSPQYPLADGLPEVVKRFKRQRESSINGVRGLNAVCDKCGYMGADWYPASKKLWWINYFVQGVCNYKCAYCKVRTTMDKDEELTDLADVVSALRGEDLLSDEYSVVLSTSGEPTLHPKRKEFYSAFDGFVFLVNSNGSIFDQDLYELAERKLVRLIVSLDAGTAETYRQVKGVDCFDRVIDNLKKYMKAPLCTVVPKYVVTTGVNDDEENIDRFCELCGELGADYAIVAYDMFSERPIPEQGVNMLRRLKRGIESKGMLCAPYTECFTYEYVTTLSEVFSEKEGAGE